MDRSTHAWVRAAVLINFIEVVDRLGGDVDALLAAQGLSRERIANVDQRLPAANTLALLEQAAQATGCITLGLRMAASRTLAQVGPISRLLGHQGNLREALTTLMRNPHLISDILALHIEEAGQWVIVRKEVLSDQPSRQAAEMAIGVLYRCCAALVGERWRPESVRFAHEASIDLKWHREVFGCRLGFDDEYNGIVLPRRLMDLPIAGANLVLEANARRFVASLPRVSDYSLALEVRKALYLMLPTGQATGAAIAQRLGLSVRTLQRQLDAEGLRFSGLLDEIRAGLAQRYLDNPHHSLAQISELLGFSAPSAFTRWFRTQFYCTPQQWRRTVLDTTRHHQLGVTNRGKR